MKKNLLVMILALTMVTSLGLTGCGKSAGVSSGTDNATKTADSKEKVKITFWDENGGPARTPLYQELIKKFEASQSEVEVEYVAIPQSDSLEKYNVAIAADSMPDSGGMQIAWLSNFIARDALIPLDSFYDKWGDKSKISEPIISGVRSSAVDKKLYMMPNSSNFSCIWYRPDLFKNAGIAAFPENWDDFFTDVEKLTDKSKNKYGFTIRGGSASASVLTDLLFAYSGITDYFDENGKCNIADPAHVEFVKRYLGMYDKYTPGSDITSGWKEISANFDTGISAMLYHNLGSYSNHLDAFKDNSKFAAAPLPKSIKGTRVVSGAASATGYGIFKTSKNADAAWKFISYLGQEDSQSYFNENIGQLPTNADSMAQPWGKKSQSISMALDTTKDSSTKSIVFPIYLPDYYVILSKTIDPAIQSVMGGKMSVEDLLKTWATEMEKSKAEYDKANK